MNNKEREVLANLFLDLRNDIEGDWDDIDGVIESLQDNKLKEMYRTYADNDDLKESIINEVRERSVDLWAFDSQNTSRDHWCLNKNYRTGGYWKKALSQIKSEVSEDDDLSMSILNRL